MNSARFALFASTFAFALVLSAGEARAQQSAPPPAAQPAPPPAAQPAPPPLQASPLQPGQAPAGQTTTAPGYPPPPGYAGTPNDYYYYNSAPPPREPPPPPPKPRYRNDTVKLTYATAVGMGPTHDFTPDFSFLGVAADWRTRVTDNFWPGFTLAWQVLYAKDYTTRTYKDFTFTGTVATTLNVFPMLVDADYYFMTDREGIRPYAGIGLGVYAAEHRIDWSIWTVQDTTWHFGFAPELGVVLPTGAASLVLTTKFNYAFASGGWDQILYWNFNIGVEL
jgi:outer membrane protein